MFWVGAARLKQAAASTVPCIRVTMISTDLYEQRPMWFTNLLSSFQEPGTFIRSPAVAFVLKPKLPADYPGSSEALYCNK